MSVAWHLDLKLIPALFQWFWDVWWWISPSSHIISTLLCLVESLVSAKDDRKYIHMIFGPLQALEVLLWNLMNMQMSHVSFHDLVWWKVTGFKWIAKGIVGTANIWYTPENRPPMSLCCIMILVRCTSVFYYNAHGQGQRGRKRYASSGSSTGCVNVTWWRNLNRDIIISNSVCLFHFMLSWSSSKLNISECEVIMCCTCESVCLWRAELGFPKDHLQSLIDSTHKCKLSQGVTYVWERAVFVCEQSVWKSHSPVSSGWFPNRPHNARLSVVFFLLCLRASSLMSIWKLMSRHLRIDKKHTITLLSWLLHSEPFHML